LTVISFCRCEGSRLERMMTATTPVVKRTSCKLVLGLVFLTTMTSSFGIRPYSQRRRQPVALATNRYGKGSTSNVASWPTFDPRLLLAGPGSSSRMSPASTVLHHSVGDVAEQKQLPVKRRWNSGNLRVWGKRRPSDGHVQTDDKLVDEVPFWLLQSARSVNNRRAPATSSEAGVSQTSGLEPRLSDRTASDKREKESSIKRSNSHRHWKNAPWLS